MITCRFDDVINNQALDFQDIFCRIEAKSLGELPAAIQAIEEHQQQGRWIVLLLSYALGEWLEPALQGAKPHDDGTPGLTALVFDRCRTEPSWGAPIARTESFIVSARPSINFEKYRRNIEQIKSWIEAGNVYQVNYTFPLDVQFTGRPDILYRTLINRHPTRHAAYIHDGLRHVLSFSPELFLQRKGTRLTSRPMKGTAPRHANPMADQESARTLLASVKDRAENVMIVDLLRNDLGKLAKPGSVRVDKLFELECYPSIWTMTSTISADIGSASLLQILKALFPCGSVTGAPKIAAMRCIRMLESAPRGLYCGSIGWLAPNGDFSFNVAIRSLVMDRAGHARYGVGGGIVYDSDPEMEWRECQWKARTLGDGLMPVWDLAGQHANES